MKRLLCGSFVFMITLPTYGQQSILVQEHELLTRDCRMIRGHSRRVVEEASATDLNSSVAAAHLGEIAKSLHAMEKRLKETKKYLSPAQLKLVDPEYTALEKICVKLNELTVQLEREFNKEEPDKFRVRKLALELREVMASGSEQHESMKRKLGLK